VRHFQGRTPPPRLPFFVLAGVAAPPDLVDDDAADDVTPLLALGDVRKTGDEPLAGWPPRDPETTTTKEVLMIRLTKIFIQN